MKGGDANLYRYVGNAPGDGVDPGGLRFWSDYWHYLTHPWDMDDDLETGFYVSGAVGVTAGAAAGGLAVAGYGGVTVGAAAKAAAPVVAAEAVDTAIEEAASAATGLPVIIPISPADAVQDGGKLLLRRAAKEAGEEIAEKAGRRAASSAPSRATPGSYLAGKAPGQVTPGTRVLQGQYVDDLGRVQPWTARYD